MKDKVGDSQQEQSHSDGGSSRWASLVLDQPDLASFGLYLVAKTFQFFIGFNLLVLGLSLNDYFFPLDVICIYHFTETR